MQAWLERAIRIHNYHYKCLASNRAWTLATTAEHSELSIGITSEDINIAKAYFDDPNSILQFTYRKDAINLVRNKKRVSPEIKI